VLNNQPQKTQNNKKGLGLRLLYVTLLKDIKIFCVFCVFVFFWLFK